MTGNVETSRTKHTGENDDRAINNHAALGKYTLLQQFRYHAQSLQKFSFTYFFKKQITINLPSSSPPETIASCPLSQTLGGR